MTITGLKTDIIDAYQHNIAGLENRTGRATDRDQLVAIYDTANSLGA